MSWLVSFLNVGPRVASPMITFYHLGLIARKLMRLLSSFVSSLQRNVVKLNDVPILLVVRLL